MLRRLAVLLLLLVPVPLAAQFTPITAPGGDLYFWMRGLTNAGGPLGDFTLYLLDDTGARVRPFFTYGPGDPLSGFLGTFTPGQIFGMEIYATDLGTSSAVLTTSSASPWFGPTVWYASVPRGPGADVEFNSIDPATVPEPAALALLATGLLGLGAVGWRRKRRQMA